MAKTPRTGGEFSITTHWISRSAGFATGASFGMRWLVAFAVVCAACLSSPAFVGPGSTPMAVWSAGDTPDPALAALIPVPHESSPQGEERSRWTLRRFYQDIEGLFTQAEPPIPDPTPEEMCEKLAVAASDTGIPAPFFARLIWQESRFNPRAVSPVGAQGVAQFMPKVAAAMGLDDPFDARAALPTSAQLLQTLYRSFGNLGLAAAAYNAGPKRIQDWLARRGKLPEETRNYVRAITGHAPEKWTVASSIDLPLNLPARAPCDGIAGMSRSGGVATIPVRLDDSVVKLIQEAKAKEARAKMAKARRALASAHRANAAKAASLAKATKSAKAATSFRPGASKAVPAPKIATAAKSAPAHKPVAIAAGKMQDRVRGEKVAVATAR